MSRINEVLAIVMLAVLAMPMTGVAGESGTAAQPSQAGSKPKAKSLSQEKSDKKAGEMEDVQSRGLFSQKKKDKKKPVGGAAGHSQPPERTDPPVQ